MSLATSQSTNSSKSILSSGPTNSSSSTSSAAHSSSTVNSAAAQADSLENVKLVDVTPAAKNVIDKLFDRTTAEETKFAFKYTDDGPSLGLHIALGKLATAKDKTGV